MITTDSEHYREIAMQHGSEAPFLRPPGMAEDASPDLPAFQHALKWLAEHEDYHPDIVVHLRPTCPIRSIVDIDRAVALLVNNSAISAVRSMSISKDNPWRMWFAQDSLGGTGSGMMQPVAIPPGNKVYPTYTTGLAGNSPRQLTPETYSQNSCIDVVRASEIMNPNGGSMTGSNVYGLVTQEAVDIDTEADFAHAVDQVA